MWDANISAPVFDASSNSYVVEFQLFNDQKTLPAQKKTFSVNPAEELDAVVLRLVQKEVDYLNADDRVKQAAVAFDPSTLAGTLTVLRAKIDAKKPVPANPPTPDAGLVAFQALVLNYRIALAAESLGLAMLVSAADLKASMKSTFQPTKEYGLSFLAFGGF